MRLITVVTSMMETNGYIVCDEDTKEAIVIDPGADGEKFIRLIEENDLSLNAIVLTHAHFDHIGGIAAIKKSKNVPVVICKGEDIIIENSLYNLSANFAKPIELKADRVLDDGEEFKFGNCTFKTILTPGHTPGSACFYFEKEGVLFSGDTLFYQSVGRTDFKLGSTEDILDSLNNKLMKLPDYVYVYSGHGPATTIEHERKYNPYISYVE